MIIFIAQSTKDYLVTSQSRHSPTYVIGVSLSKLPKCEQFFEPTAVFSNCGLGSSTLPRMRPFPQTSQLIALELPRGLHAGAPKWCPHQIVNLHVCSSTSVSDLHNIRLARGSARRNPYASQGASVVILLCANCCQVSNNCSHFKST